MAKTGFWLRGSRGKLAGASLGKGPDGSTVAREIVTPKNPRTNKQYAQRAIMATVMQAYSAGKEIFDHAFEGVSRGSACQREFISRNARILRTHVAAEINSATAVGLQGRVVAPKALYPVPFGGMMLSRGTYDQDIFTIATDEESSAVMFSLPAAADADESLVEYCDRLGIVTDDLYTIVIYSVGDEQQFAVAGVDTPYAKQFNCKFGFIRLRVKDVSESEALVSAATFNDLFTVDKTSIAKTNSLMQSALTLKIGLATIVVDSESGLGALGIIRSREDEDLRSTSYLQLAGLGNNFGLTAPYLLAAWKQGTEQVGNSELILEGGNF